MIVDLLLLSDCRGHQLHQGGLLMAWDGAEPPPILKQAVASTFPREEPVSSHGSLVGLASVLSAGPTRQEPSLRLGPIALHRGVRDVSCGFVIRTTSSSNQPRDSRLAPSLPATQW